MMGFNRAEQVDDERIELLEKVVSMYLDEDPKDHTLLMRDLRDMVEARKDNLEFELTRINELQGLLS